MHKEFMMKTLKELISGLARMMGENTEIVLHDLALGEIVHIENGHVTGRRVGAKISKSIYEAIKREPDRTPYLIGYSSHTIYGKELKSSHFYISDEKGEDYALICINHDISLLRAARDELNAIIGTQRPDLPSEESGNYIQVMTKRAIWEEIEKAKPFSADSREAKLEIVRRLDEKGVFDVKDAMQQICELLEISQATLYNYQREVRFKAQK